MEIDVREAESGDVEVVAAVLTEAAQWLDSSGMGMWRANELSARISTDVANGLSSACGPADRHYQISVVRCGVWPNVPEGDSALVHRLAVRRTSAGKGVSTALLRGQ